MFIQILKGIAHFHNLGIIHHDIKFSNIAISNEYEIKLIDFGMSGYVVLPGCGTFGHIAPEAGLAYASKARDPDW